MPGTPIRFGWDALIGLVPWAGDVITAFNGRTIASHLANPDYVKLAESFGVTGRRATSPEALQTELREAIKADEPTLIEVPVEQMPDPWKALKLR